MMYTSSILAIALLNVDIALAASTTDTSTRAPESTIEPSTTAIAATQATAPALSPVSNVKGAGFDRLVQIWLENTVIEYQTPFLP
jgi:acid phosphatase